MLKIIEGIVVYALWCAAGYVVMDYLYRKASIHALPNVKKRWVYYLLQFTWGLPMNVFGLVVAAALMCCGVKPKKYGWNYCFEIKTNAGMEMGMFFVAPINGSTHLKNHEHGHGIQNIYFGPFSVGMVSIPSAARFWTREIQYKLKRPPKTAYDDIWFEGQATKTGERFLAEIEEERY